MPKALTIISNDPSIPQWIDFDQLRSEGLQHIARFSSDIWTDHNLHDPGITILEVLCYALADLGYRNSLSVGDLLAPAPDTESKADNNFFTAAQVLTCNPLTINDYRKMLMDVKGVRNAWLEVVGNKVQSNRPVEEQCTTYLNGLYKVVIELETILPANKTAGDILNEVEILLHDHRNLCEDFDEITLLKDEEIGLCGDLELEPDAIPEEVTAQVMINLQNFLSPQITFYTLQGLLDKGKKIEDILEGRPLTSESHGFIDTADLEAIELRKELHASDLYRVIMETEGVRAVRRLKLFNLIGGARQTVGEEWCLKLTRGYRPIISLQHTAFRIFKNILRYDLDKVKVESLFLERISNVSKAPKKSEQLDRSIPVGQYRPDLGSYRSVQHEFPLNYRIGLDQLPQSASNERKAQKLQLKGYLMFYDQLLANYLAQLKNLRKLFSMRSNGDPISYYVQGLNDVPEVEMLLRSLAKYSFYDENEVVALPDEEDFFSNPEHRDQVIQQLIKGFENDDIEIEIEKTDEGKFRFKFSSIGQGFTLFSNKLFVSEENAIRAAEPLYFLGTLDRCYHRIDDQADEKYSFKLINKPSSYQDYLRQITETPAQARQRRSRFLDHLLARFAEEFTDYTMIMFALEGKKRDEAEIIKDKENFLNNYPDLSRNRSKGFNYKSTDPLWNSDNVSGMERRVAGLMGINQWKRSNLCNFEIASKALLFHAEVRGCSGELIFRSPKGRDDEQAANQDLRLIADHSGNAAGYKLFECPKGQVIECPKGKVFGFHLEDSDGNVVGIHPHTYSNREAAQQKISWLSQLAGAGTCVLVETSWSDAGWFFYLKDKNGRRIFKCKTGYCSKEEVRNALHHFILAAVEEENYVAEDDPLTRMFGFYVKAPNADIHTNYLSTFCSKKKRCQAVRAAFDFIGSKQLNYEISKKPDSFGWSLTDQNDGKSILLQSEPSFNTEQQSKDNFKWFTSIGQSGLRYHDDKDEEGRHAFFVREKDGFIAARSPWFKTGKKRDEAREKAIEAIRLHVNPDRTIKPEIYYFKHPAAWSFVMFDDYGRPLLEGVERFDSEEIAQWAFYSFLEQATTCNLCKIIKEEGGCRYTIVFEGHCGVIATHPDWYLDKIAAQAACRQIVEYMAANKFDFEIVREPFMWRFEIYWEDCAGRKAPLLWSEYKFQDQKEAREQGDAVVSNFKEEQLEKAENESGCSGFYLKDVETEERIAFHPSAYLDIKRRDKTFDRAKDYLKGGIKWSSEVFETMQKSAKWRFEIYEEGNAGRNKPLLTGNFKYEERQAAQNAIESVIAGFQEKQLVPIKDEIPGYSYSLSNERGEAIAIHPVTYRDIKSRNEKLVKAKEILNEKTKLQIDTACTKNEDEFVKWRYEIYEQDSEGQNKPLVFSDFKFENCKVAHDAGRETIYCFKEAHLVPIYREIHSYSFYLKNENGDRIADHPAIYSDEKCWEKKFEKAKELLNNNIKPDSITFIPFVETNQTFRLVSKSHNIAAHPITYRHASIRDNEYRRLLQMAQSDGLPFTEIVVEGDVVSGKGMEWRFVLKDKKDGNEWWQSAVTFPSEEDAKNSFKENFKEILKQARNEKRYQVKVDDRHTQSGSNGHSSCYWKVELLGCNQIPLAEIQQRFDTKAAAEQAASERKLWAIGYPIKDRGEGWQIEVTDIADDNKVLWKGGHSYKDYDEAWKAFGHFLNLATYPDNYHRSGDADAGFFNLSLKEILLEGKGEPTDEKEAWVRANLFAMETEQQGNFLPFEQYETCCRYGFRSVSDQYVLARHTRRYHTPNRREEALELLYAEARCRWRPPISIDWRFCIKAGELHFEIMVDNDWVWRSVKSFAPGTNQGLKYFFGDENTSKEKRNYYLDLIEYARHAEFYQFWEEGTEEEPVFKYGLLNMEGELEMIHPGNFTTKEARKAHAASLIKLFRLYPVLKTEGTYYFQYYTFEEYWADEHCETESDHPKEPGFLLWESAQSYDGPGAAQTAFDNFYRLSTQLTSYWRSNEDGGRYFSIEITDPHEVFAEHPLTYTNPEEMRDVMNVAREQLNSEGFHVIEHILFRPNGCPGIESGGTIHGPCKTKEDEEEIIRYSVKGLSDSGCGATLEENVSKCYVPGADIYSFWITIVLPWWPARFQDLDFRKFFQNTLRREAPAHVGLRILWVSPEDMCKFETKYKSWLEAISMPGDCGKCTAQTALKNVVFNDIQSGNPPPHLDELGFGNPIVLDETYLSF